MSGDRMEGLLAPLLASAYRTALCLANEPAEAEAMLVEAAGRWLRHSAQPDDADDVRCRVLRSIAEVFRQGHRHCRGAAGRGDEKRRPGALSEGDRIVTTIRELGPSSRIVAALYFCEGLTCGQIAQVLGCSRPPVHRRVVAARAALRSLGTVGGEPANRGASGLPVYRPAPGAAPASGGSTSRATT